MGLNPRALGTNPKAMRKVRRKIKREGWEPRPRAKGEPLPKWLRFEILKRDGFRCRYCGATGRDVYLHVDHIHPRALGGTDDPSNLTTACETCNVGKGATPLDTRLAQ